MGNHEYKILSEDAIKYLCGLIRDLASVSEGIDNINLADDKTFSNIYIKNLIDKCLEDANAEAEKLVGALTHLTCEETAIQPTLDNSEINVIYLYSADGNPPYQQFLKISEDKLIDLGSTSISLEDYIKAADVAKDYATKVELKAVTDKIGTTTLTTTDTTITGAIEEVKGIVDGKADKSEIPTTVSELTDSADYAKKTDLHSHDNKSVLDGITSDKVTAWDNKSDFSGSYNDLNDKPTIDAELSNTSENAIQNKVVTKEINKLYSDISFNDFDTATDDISFTDAEDGNMIVTDWTKNLLNPTVETCEVNGVTCTRNVDANGKPDGTYTLNGKATADTFFWFSSVKTDKNASYNCLGTPHSLSELVRLVFLNNEIWRHEWGTGVIIKDCDKITPSIFVPNGKIVSDVIVKPMITTDLSATYDDFVPYSGYEIQSCGKNLLDFDTWANNVHINGGEKIVSGNSIKITAKSNDCFTNYSSNATTFISKIKCKPNTTYTFSYKKECEEGVLGRSYLFENGNTNNMVFSEENTVTITTTSNAEFLTFRIGVQNAGDYITYYNLQLEKGSEPTAYEPYTDETITVTNDTESPSFGLKSHKGITNIISPGNVKCVYPTNESGKGVLDSLYNKDKMLTEQNKIKNDLGGLTFSASGTTLSITDGTNTWTLGANS